LDNDLSLVDDNSEGWLETAAMETSLKMKIKNRNDTRLVNKVLEQNAIDTLNS
jgi:hypothetical protein